MTRSVGRRIVLVLTILWRISLGVGASTFVVGGIRILTGGPDCRAVRFDMRPRLVLYRCVADPGFSSAEMSAGVAGSLMLGLGVAMLALATLPLWRNLWYSRGGGRGRQATPPPGGIHVPPARVPVVMPAATRECPWCTATVDEAATVCRSCGCEIPPVHGAVAPPVDEWSGLRATHPHSFGVVLHAAEQISKAQWPPDIHRALGRACVLFTTEGLDANRAVQRAFEEATGVARVADSGDNGEAGPGLPPRLRPG